MDETRNTAFAAFFLKDISHKLESLSQRQASPQSFGALTMRVRQAPVNAPLFVSPATTLHEAAIAMDEAGQRAHHPGVVVDASRAGEADSASLRCGRGVDVEVVEDLEVVGDEPDRSDQDAGRPRAG